MTSGPSLIGLDLGTTHLKAAAFTLQGEELALAKVPTPTHRLPGGGGEHDPDRLWEGVVQCLSQIQGAVAARPVVGVGIASLGESGVLLDAAGQPVYPFIAWFDPRTRKQVAFLTDRLGLDTLFFRTGLYASAKHGLCKLLWLKDEHPAAFERGVVWLSAAEYVAFRLTGRAAACPSLACRTLAFDLARGRWADDLLSAAGVPISLFPPVVAEGAPVGAVTEAVAAATGLPLGTPVTLGGHDHPCAALAAGVAGPGQLLDSTGTAEAIIGAIDRPLLTPAVLESQISQGPLPVPGLYGFQAGIAASGGSLEWLRREFWPEADYGALEQIAGAVGDGPSGLLFLPHLAGAGPPAVEPASRGAIVGLTYGTERGHVIKAVLEGTCYELRRLVAAMEQLVRVPFVRMVATGGHTHNRLWLQLKANVLGRPVTVPAVGEATLLRAALLAGVAGGVFGDARDAAQSVAGRERTIAPNPDVAEAYEEFYARYAGLFPALRPLYRAWSA